jgi:hypothetical protein
MISRDDVIERSVEVYLRNQVFGVRGYPPDRVRLLDIYPDDKRLATPLDMNYVAIGYTFDDGGRQAELGSNLKRRLHTIDFHVFGISRVWAKNLATVIRSSLESDGVINLLDPATDAVIDHVDVDYVSAQLHPVKTPRPWEENIWITRLRVEDYFDSSSGG